MHFFEIIKNGLNEMVIPLPFHFVLFSSVAFLWFCTKCFSHLNPGFLEAAFYCHMIIFGGKAPRWQSNKCSVVIVHNCKSTHSPSIFVLCK